MDTLANAGAAMAYACLPCAGLSFEVHPETSVSFGGLSDAEIEAMIQERQACS